MTDNTSNSAEDEWTSEYPEIGDYDLEPYIELKECPYCKGTGIDRKVEADCLTCYGEGYV